MLTASPSTALVGTQASTNGGPDSKPATPAKPALKAKHAIPKWASDARWYQVVVSRFHNGDRSNDPEGTLPWTTDWPREGDPAAADAGKLDARRYGGDLKGLRKRLPYLKQLGINALYLTSIFRTGTGNKPDAIDLWHVDDTLGVKKSLTRVNNETLDPKSWRFSASDRVFLAFLEEAHKRGFRVTVEAAFGDVRHAIGARGEVEGHLLEITRRWMDPDSDGDPSDGVDGWVLREPGKLPHELWKRWRAHAKRINPDALLIGDIHGDPSPWLGDNAFDVAINHEVAGAIRRFFGAGKQAYTLREFFADLAAANKRHNPDTRLASLIRLSGPRTGRLLSALSQPPSSTATMDSAASRLTEEVLARWRLARVFQYFYLGAPVIYYGDEVGMRGRKGPLSLAPMWWKDLPDPGSKSADYRDDFTSLIQWLNIRRDIRAPLRSGSFRTVLLDEKRRVFAFARSLMGDEVILAVNYGDKKQKVMVPAGKPGQLVGVLGPQFGAVPGRLRPGKKDGDPPKHIEIRPLRMGGNRQFVDADGRVRLWLDPMSIRVVLVTKEEPW